MLDRFSQPWKILERDGFLMLRAADGTRICHSVWHEGMTLDELRWSIDERTARVAIRWVASLPDRLRPDYIPPVRQVQHGVKLPLPWDYRAGFASHPIVDARGREILKIAYRVPARPGWLSDDEARQWAQFLIDTARMMAERSTRYRWSSVAPDRPANDHPRMNQIATDEQLQRDRIARLIQWCGSTGLPRSHVAERAGMSRQNFARFFDGTRTINSSTAEQIARGWGLGPQWCGWLLYGTDQSG